MSDERATNVEAKQRKRMEALWWAGALIWVGLVLGAHSLGILPRIGDPGEWWIWIFVGGGLYAAALNIYFLTSPDWPSPSAWDWIWTAIFLIIGLGGAFDFGGDIVGPVVLIGVGAIILARTLRGRE